MRDQLYYQQYEYARLTRPIESAGGNGYKNTWWRQIVIDLMVANNYNIRGEQTWNIIFKDHVYHRR
jgi:hypothetical protein